MRCLLSWSQLREYGRSLLCMKQKRVKARLALAWTRWWHTPRFRFKFIKRWRAFLKGWSNNSRSRTWDIEWQKYLRSWSLLLPKKSNLTSEEKNGIKSIHQEKLSMHHMYTINFCMQVYFFFLLTWHHCMAHQIDKTIKARYFSVPTAHLLCQIV